MGTGQARHDHARASLRGGLCRLLRGALDLVGRQHNKDASKARVTADVTIGPREAGGFGLAVKLRVEDRSLPQGSFQLVNEAHEKICPYSHATRGNVDVQIEVQGA